MPNSRIAETEIAMTNSASFAEAKWLDAGEMRRWISDEAVQAQPRIAYLDLARALP